MKVLFLTNFYPPNVIGGYEKLCFQVAEKMAPSHEVSVLTSSFGGNVESYERQDVERSLTVLAHPDDIYAPFDIPIEERVRINDENIRIFQNAVARINPDVIFVWNLIFFDRTFYEAVLNSGKRVVIFLTDTWLISLLNPGFNGSYYQKISKSGNDTGLLTVWRLFRNLASRRHGSQRCEAIFSSRFMERMYREAGIRFQRTAIIHNGVNLYPVPVRSGYEIAGSEIRILFAGRVVEVKGVHVLIEALSKIYRKNAGLRFHLTIIGDRQDSKYNDGLARMIEERGMRNLISMQLPVLEKDLIEEFARHDVYIFPSLHEPFSLTLIHALHSGIPVIASDAGGNREIMASGVNGLMYDRLSFDSLAGAIIEMAGDAKFRERLATNAIKSTFRFSLDSMVRLIDDYLLHGNER